MSEDESSDSGDYMSADEDLDDHNRTVIDEDFLERNPLFH